MFDRMPSADLGALAQDALAQLSHGLCVWSGDGRILLSNPAFLAMHRLPPELAKPGTPRTVVESAMAGAAVAASGTQPPRPPGPGSNLREWRLDDGRTIRVTATTLADGRCLELHEDVTEARWAATQAQQVARHDGLTGLVNRAELHDALRQACAGDVGDSALLCLDLDGFKAVNDRFGHLAGDELLRQVGQRLRDCVRGGDVVARLGGDEFAVLQRHTPQPAGARALARRLIAQLGQPFDLAGQLAHVGASVGVAVLPFDAEDPDSALRSADLARLQAKESGSDALRFFEPGMLARDHERQSLVGDLRAALAEGQFELAYQAQVDAAAGRVCGVEALLRWNHPTLGRVPPDRFIPQAEASGLIVPIGCWVLQQACQDALTWPADVRVAVNVSAAQFQHGTLLRDVAQALEASGLPPRRLELEITESAMLEEPERVVRQLHALRHHGVRVAMDDFGTGYSSLATLRSFPFDRIKIDRSFVRDVVSNAEALAIVRAVTGLGRSLGMSTTVEGVETDQQLDLVRREGCDEVQGYLFSRPAPAAELSAVIARLARTAVSGAETVPDSV